MRTTRCKTQTYQTRLQHAGRHWHKTEAAAAAMNCDWVGDIWFNNQTATDGRHHDHRARAICAVF